METIFLTIALLVFLLALAAMMMIFGTKDSDRPLGSPPGPIPPAPPRNKPCPTNNPGTGTPPPLQVRLVDVSTMCHPNRFMIIEPEEHITFVRPAKPRGCPFDEPLPPPA